jgi:hypothetical protein
MSGLFDNQMIVINMQTINQVRLQAAKSATCHHASDI